MLISNSPENFSHKPTAEFYASSGSTESSPESSKAKPVGAFFFLVDHLFRVGHGVHYQLLQFTTTESGITQVMREFREFRCSDINISLALFLVVCGCVYVVIKRPTSIEVFAHMILYFLCYAAHLSFEYKYY